jgi:glycosyltransferase involved in cell wall biosynthesis
LKNHSVSTAVFADEYFLKDNWFALRRSMAKSSARLIFSEEAFPKIIKQKFGNVGAHIILPQSLPIAETSSQSSLYDVPYFLCYTKVASKLEVLQLFKAFSFFKRRMNSSTKLILLTEGIEQTELVDNFQNYKFRGDVHFESNPDKEKLFNLLTNCIAWINLTPSSTPFFPIYLAAQAAKPVIARADGLKAEVFGETLAYFDSQETLAAQMINMYKDENLRSFFADLGLSMAAQKINEFQNLALNKLLANTVH